MSTTPLPPSAPPAAGTPSNGPCGYCGALLAADQRYCLSCGARRGDTRVEYARLLTPGAAMPAPAAARAGTADAPPAPQGARTVSPLGAASGLGLLLLAVLVGAVIGGAREPATQATPIVLPAATTPATAQATEFVTDWTGEDGWTVQVQVLPKESTTPQQVIDAKSAATSAGAPAVGALDSDEYPSLDPGAYVVYSGAYASRKEARSALATLKSSFPDARVVEISATAAEEEAAAEDPAGDAAADSALEALENASPEEYAEKSKKLPDELGTGGSALPTDDKAPGGGSDDALVIE